MPSKQRPPQRPDGTVDWPALIHGICGRHGWTQVAIAAQVGVNENSIKHLASGRTRDPRHRTGERLVRLWRLANRAQA